jgi:hypothetical protein
MKKTIFILFFLSIISLQKILAQKTPLKKDTVYVLVDTGKVPVKDRMFNITKEGRFKVFTLMCNCYPWQTNPQFTYGWERPGTLLSNGDFKKVKTISISELIKITSQFGQDKMEKTIFYFVEPERGKWRMHETFLMPARNPMTT